MNLPDLCIVEQKFCFVIFVDITVLSVDGNILGAISLGILAAIHRLPVPSVEVDHTTFHSRLFCRYQCQKKEVFQKLNSMKRSVGIWTLQTAP